MPKHQIIYFALWVNAVDSFVENIWMIPSSLGQITKQKKSRGIKESIIYMLMTSHKMNKNYVENSVLS